MVKKIQVDRYWKTDRSSQFLLPSQRDNTIMITKTISRKNYRKYWKTIIEKLIKRKKEKQKGSLISGTNPVKVKTIGGKKRRKPSEKVAEVVEVFRKEEIVLKLPISVNKQRIVEVINENSIVIITGQTGSGKTTQIPQFLYEAGYALKKQIAVTEPRRVAAMSMSQRVAGEMNLSSNEVSYSVRFESNVTKDTKITFLTDDVLFREVQADPILSKYSVVIVDEAHERSIYTEVLIGLFSRILSLRHQRDDPLKFVIMSATLRLEDFFSNPRLFKIPPPVIKLEGRQFPVTVHYQERAHTNYLRAAFNKILKIHTTLPEGGILVFVTGQQEVDYLVRKLRRMFPLKVEEERRSPEDYGVPSNTEFDGNYDIEVNGFTNAQPLWTLPLFTHLSADRQQKVFQPPPLGCRLCVVSTNVAETSLTIPGIKYVVDTGKVKIQRSSNYSDFTRVDWTSKVSADQRAGQAGRVGPGHCFRLYTSAIFNDTFKVFSVPEIQQKPLDELYLQMKHMNIDRVGNFPFLSTPDEHQLRAANWRLTTLGALKKGRITPLGKSIVQMSVAPRYGKMLLLCYQRDRLAHAICLVAALSVPGGLFEEPTFATPQEWDDVESRRASARRQWLGDESHSLLLGDGMVLLLAVAAAEFASANNRLEKFCKGTGIRPSALLYVRKARLQLTNEFKKIRPKKELEFELQTRLPTDREANLLRRLLLVGAGYKIAKKIEPNKANLGQSHEGVKYLYQTVDPLSQPVFLKISALTDVLPKFVVYQDIYEITDVHGRNTMYLRGVSAIQATWLPRYVRNLCQYTATGSYEWDPAPTYNPTTGRIYCRVSCLFGPWGWSIPETKIVHPPSYLAYWNFAFHLHQGEVFWRLKKYVPFHYMDGEIVWYDFCTMPYRGDMLVKALQSRKCCSKGSLETIWRRNPRYLMKEYFMWIPPSKRREVRAIWPPLDSFCQMN